MRESDDRLQPAYTGWQPVVLLAVVMTAVVGGGVWLYPVAIEAVAARWGENAARRSAWLAREGRLDEAESALARAAARKKVWIDADVTERQRVYLGKRVWTDHRDFAEAATAFLEAGAADPARRAAWEAIWRYHAVNRAGEDPALWRALSDASDALGDEAVAREAERVAQAWEEGVDLLWPIALAPTNAGDRVPSRRPDRALAPTSFRVQRDGRFNPANAYRATTSTIFFDRPCVAVADVADADAVETGALHFEARSQRAYGWPAILVAQFAGRTRFAVIGSTEWTPYEIDLGPPTGKAPRELRLSYLNHGAEESEARTTLRTLEIRGIELR